MKVESKLLLLVSFLAIGVGLTYSLRLYGYSEREVVVWGHTSIFLGLSLLLTFLFHSKKVVAFLIRVVLLVCHILMQILPIWLWFCFHGSSINDGSPMSEFAGHWAYAIPHMIIIFACIYLIDLLKKQILKT
jgi:hypothetical protein